MSMSMIEVRMYTEIHEYASIESVQHHGNHGKGV